MSTGITLPIGRARGQDIADAPLDDFEWCFNTLERNVCSGTSRFPDKDKAWLEAAAPVLKQRQEGVAVQLVTASQALANVGIGAINNAREANEALEYAREIGHLVSPAPAVGFIPEGCSVMVSGIMVNRERESYEHSGSSERGLSKVALDKIGGAAGIDWDPRLSVRLDDGTDPYYRCCQAVGRVRNFDGTWRHLEDKKEIDLRDGSARVQAILEREAAKRKKEGDKYRGDGGFRDIAMQRLHILSLCTTEARLRATRILGLRTAYTPEELLKPFVVVQMVFDGRSANPETAKYFRERIADSFLGASRQLYGAPSPAPAPREVQTIELPELEPEPASTWTECSPKRTGTGGPY